MQLGLDQLFAEQPPFQIVGMAAVGYLGLETEPLPLTSQFW